MDPNWNSTTLPHGIHAYTRGSGPPLVLLAGWPETADAFSEIFPHLSPHYRIYAIDPPGLGDSDPSPSSYDTATISTLLESSLRATISKPFHLLGHEVGAWIAYAWAAQYPSSILSLTVLDSAIPGHGPSLAFPLPRETNLRLWQFSFNTLPDLPEVLTAGRERQLFDWLFDRKAVHPERITEAKRRRYVQCYSRLGGMSAGFEYYRAVANSAVRHAEFASLKLEMPVLALGGEGAVGKGMVDAMMGLAEDVSGGVVEDCGHYLVEEQPERVAEMVLEFLKGVDRRVE